MKENGMKYLVNPPQVGEIYRVEHEGQEVYDARIIEHDGGCWATVKVEKVLSSPYMDSYKPGQVFDLKLSNYALYEFVETGA